LESYKKHFSRNFQLAYPVILSQVGHVLVGVADSVMVGRIGAVPLGAASLANGIFFVGLIFGLGVTTAITPLVARAHTQNQIPHVAELLKHGFISAMMVALVLFGIILNGEHFIRLLNQPEEVVVAAIPYLKIITYSFIPLLVFQSFRQFSEGYSLTFPPMVISIGANVVNVALNYAFIYGKFGFPAWGLLGAGYATLISRVVMMVAIVLYYMKHPRFQEVRSQFQWKGMEWKTIKQIFTVGIPTGLQSLFEYGAFSAAVVMMGWISTAHLAAHQIAISLASISFMFCSGIGTAASIRVGNQWGLQNIPELRRAGFSTMAMGMVIMSVTGVLFAVFGSMFAGWYIDNEEVIAIASHLLIVAAAFQLSDGLQVIALGALRGLQDVRIPAIITFVAYWIIGLPLSYILGFWMNWSGVGIWIGLAVGLTASGMGLTWRFNLQTKRLLRETPLAIPLT
jgi:MATE family multidrug resistance protein